MTGQCHRCGYSRTGISPSAVCPECGVEPLSKTIGDPRPPMTEREVVLGGRGGYWPEPTGVHSGAGMLPYRLRAAGETLELVAAPMRPRAYAWQLPLILLLASPWLAVGVVKQAQPLIWLGVAILSLYCLVTAGTHLVLLRAAPVLRIDRRAAMLEVRGLKPVPLAEVRAIDFVRYSVRSTSGRHVSAGLRRIAIQIDAPDAPRFFALRARPSNMQEVAQSLAAALNVPCRERDLGELRSAGSFVSW